MHPLSRGRGMETSHYGLGLSKTSGFKGLKLPYILIIHFFLRFNQTVNIDLTRARSIHEGANCCNREVEGSWHVMYPENKM